MKNTTLSSTCTSLYDHQTRHTTPPIAKIPHQKDCNYSVEKIHVPPIQKLDIGWEKNNGPYGDWGDRRAWGALQNCVFLVPKKKIFIIQKLYTKSSSWKWICPFKANCLGNDISVFRHTALFRSQRVILLFRRWALTVITHLSLENRCSLISTKRFVGLHEGGVDGEFLGFSTISGISCTITVVSFRLWHFKPQWRRFSLRGPGHQIALGAEELRPHADGRGPGSPARCRDAIRSPLIINHPPTMAPDLKNAAHLKTLLPR